MGKVGGEDEFSSLTIAGAFSLGFNSSFGCASAFGVLLSVAGFLPFVSCSAAGVFTGSCGFVSLTFALPQLSVPLALGLLVAVVPEVVAVEVSFPFSVGATLEVDAAGAARGFGLNDFRLAQAFCDG